MKYGFRAFELISTPPRSFKKIDFSKPAPGLRSLLEQAARARVDKGERDDSKSTFTRFDQVEVDAWGVLITLKGGSFGIPAEIVASSDGGDSRNVDADDAILRDSRLLFIVPPSGDTGVVFTEIQGRTHYTQGVLRLLNNYLQQHGLKLRTDHGLADAHAWIQYLSSDEAGVRGVELTQKSASSDRTNFTTENVKKSLLRIEVEKDSEVRNRLFGALQSLRGSTVPSLAGVIGLRHGFSDDDFDEEKIVAVVDGNEKKISVATGWPTFVYDFDGDERPDDEVFVRDILEVARKMMPDLNIDVATNWRPQLPKSPATS